MTLAIAIVGDGPEAALFATLVARLARGGAVETTRAGDTPGAPMQLDLPPSIADAHRLLGIPEEAVAAIGEPHYGIRIAHADGTDICIPYGRYGDPQVPAFIDAWQRCRDAGRAEPLAAYPANAAMMAGASLKSDADPLVVRTLTFGWTVDRAAYRKLLGDVAARLGIEAGDAGGGDTDLVVDASEGGAVLLAPGGSWQGTSSRWAAPIRATADPGRSAWPRFCRRLRGWSRCCHGAKRSRACPPNIAVCSMPNGARWVPPMRHYGASPTPV